MITGFPHWATLHQRGGLVIEPPPLACLLALHVRHCTATLCQGLGTVTGIPLTLTTHLPLALTSNTTDPIPHTLNTS